MLENNLLNLGERRVRVSFNPSEKSLVNDIKLKTAELINLLQQQREAFRAEKEGDIQTIEDALRMDDKNRLISIAQTKYEEAAMWAVKAATA